MKISIVIPAHNEEKGIVAALRAAAAQTYPDFEVIMVNNASTDRTAELAASVAGVRVVTETQKGLLHARERGRKEATGEIIANMDADCLPHPDWLSGGAAYFRNRDVVAVSGPYDYYDGGALFRYSSLLLQTTGYPLAHFVTHRLFGKSAVIIGGNTMIRASTLAAINGYTTSILFYGEDTDTAKRLAEHGRIIFSPRNIMPTSARRFTSVGVLKVSWLYLVNFLWVSFLGRPYTQGM